MTEAISKAERRRQMITAGIQCFSQKGYHGAQISDIIKQAGVARGTFYLYFKSKREIFDEIMKELFDIVRARVQALPRDASDQIPQQLRGNLERITQLLLQEPWILKLLFADSMGLDAELDLYLKNFYTQLLDLIERALRQGNEMGFVRPANYPVLAMALFGAVKEIFYQYYLGTRKPNPQEIVDELYSTIVRAVAVHSLWEHLLK